MMTFTDFVNSDQGLTLVGAFAAAIWALAKTGKWFAHLQDQRLQRALEILEAAIEETYRTYVQAIKAARADGKLTEDERRNARQMARERAIALGKLAGVDVLRVLGEPFIDLWLTRLVNRAKSNSDARWQTLSTFR